MYDVLFGNIDFTYIALTEYQILVDKNNQTNSQLGKLFRNTLFAESNKEIDLLKKLTPQQLSYYGYIDFVTPTNEALTDSAKSTVIDISGEVEDGKNVLTIYLNGVDKNNAKHLVVHLFDRQRNKNQYNFSKLDYIFEIINEDVVQLKSNIGFENFDYEHGTNTLTISITGTFDL